MMYNWYEHKVNIAIAIKAQRYNAGLVNRWSHVRCMVCDLDYRHNGPEFEALPPSSPAILQETRTWKSLVL